MRQHFTNIKKSSSSSTYIGILFIFDDKIGYTANTTKLDITYDNNHQCSLYFSNCEKQPQNNNNNNDSIIITWYSLKSKCINDLVVCGDHLYIFLKGITLLSNNYLVLQGSFIRAEFQNCTIGLTYIHTNDEGPYFIGFSHQKTPIHGLYGKINNTGIENAFIGDRGCQLQCYNNSNVSLIINNAENTRTMRFMKDNTSKIIAKLPEENFRSVESNCEYWNVGRRLENISLYPYFGPIELNQSSNEKTQSMSSLLYAQNHCAICLDNSVSCLIEPCKHLCLCETCAYALNKKWVDKCPICCTLIYEINRIFMC